jgi:hypothetical protein
LPEGAKNQATTLNDCRCCKILLHLCQIGVITH